MKKVGILSATLLTLLLNVANANDNAFVANAVPVPLTPIPLYKDSSKLNTPEKQKSIRVQIEYIVDEEGKNYVVYINSEAPELNQRIIRMIENMPVDPASVSRKNSLVIEYEL